jgi:integrase
VPGDSLDNLGVTKGGHERRVPLTIRAAKAINAHLSYRPQAAMDEPLLVYRKKALQPYHVRRWLGIFADRGRVERLTLHRLRHTYATRLINTGKMPITTLQKLMGHRKLDTTMHYVALYNEKVIADYQAAMETSQNETDLKRFPRSYHQMILGSSAAGLSYELDNWCLHSCSSEETYAHDM